MTSDFDVCEVDVDMQMIFLDAAPFSSVAPIRGCMWTAGIPARIFEKWIAFRIAKSGGGRMGRGEGRGEGRFLCIQCMN